MKSFNNYVDWDVLGNVIQSKDRFALTERLAVHLDHLRMLVGNGRMPKKTKGQPLDVLNAFINNIVVRLMHL